MTTNKVKKCQIKMDLIAYSWYLNINARGRCGNNK